MLNLLKLLFAVIAGGILAAAGQGAWLHTVEPAATMEAPAQAFSDAGTRFVDCMLAAPEKSCRLNTGAALPEQTPFPAFRSAGTMPNDETMPAAPFFGAVMIWGLLGLGAMGAGAIWTLRE